MEANKEQFVKTILYIKHLINCIKWLVLQNNIKEAKEKLKEANALIKEVEYDNTWWKRKSEAW